MPFLYTLPTRDADLIRELCRCQCTGFVVTSLSTALIALRPIAAHAGATLGQAGRQSPKANRFRGGMLLDGVHGCLYNHLYQKCCPPFLICRGKGPCDIRQKGNYSIRVFPLSCCADSSHAFADRSIELFLQLGHTGLVSFGWLLARMARWLASGSGDQTVKLWEVLKRRAGAQPQRPYRPGQLGGLQPGWHTTGLGQPRQHYKYLGGRSLVE